MNDFRSRYPQYADIEDIIHRARAERSAALGELIASAVEAAARGIGSALEYVFTSVAQHRSRHPADAGHFAPGSAHR
jgi:hypothetical protein